MQSWLSFWEDCKSLGPTPPASGGHGTEVGRLFVGRLRVFEVEVGGFVAGVWVSCFWFWVSCLDLIWALLFLVLLWVSVLVGFGWVLLLGPPKNHPM